MLRTDEDALICDFAETYHVLDWRELPTGLAATLAVGLPDGSRIKRLIGSQKLTLEQQLFAVIADRLGILAWQNTIDGQKGRNAPKSILDELQGNNSGNTAGFDSADDFMAAWSRRVGGAE